MGDLMPGDWDDMNEYLALYDCATALFDSGATVPEAEWEAIWTEIDQEAARLDLEVARP